MIYSLHELDDLVCKTISNTLEEPIVYSINNLVTEVFIDLTWLLIYNEVRWLVTAKSVEAYRELN